MDGRVFTNETMVQPTRVTAYTIFLVLLWRAVQPIEIRGGQIQNGTRRFYHGLLLYLPYDLNKTNVLIFYLAPLKNKAILNYIWSSSSYRAVNTFRLGYENQSLNVV